MKSSFLNGKYTVLAQLALSDGPFTICTVASSREFSKDHPESTNSHMYNQ